FHRGRVGRCSRPQYRTKGKASGRDGGSHVGPHARNQHSRDSRHNPRDGILPAFAQDGDTHMAKCVDQFTSDRAVLYNGDSVEILRDIPSESVHYAIYSPPFASLYTYSNSERDLGNCRNRDEFFEHYRFIAKELYRVLKPGRVISFHCMNLPSTKERDGFIGVHDFRGELIRAHQADGFIFHSEVCIWKDPVTAMQRTKAIGLLYKQLRKDSCISRQAIPDYLVTMRKPGENPERVTKTHESFPVDKWQNYASPVWMDINPSDTLQRESAREDQDERHICPLQLQVIERGIELWTNPNDVVLS